MTDMEPGLSRLVVGMRLTRHGSTHLTSKSIPVENLRTNLFGNIPRERWQRLDVQQKVLTRLEAGAVIVRENLITFLVSKLSHTPCPFGYAARHGSQLFDTNDSAGIGQEVRSQLVPCAHDYSAAAIDDMGCDKRLETIFRATAAATGDGKALPTWR